MLREKASLSYSGWGRSLDCWTSLKGRVLEANRIDNDFRHMVKVCVKQEVGVGNEDHLVIMVWGERKKLGRGGVIVTDDAFMQKSGR